jgi:hypothetical protein
MNDFLQGIEDDVALIFCNEQEFATEALWTDDIEGFTHPFPAIFGSPYIPLDVSDAIQSDSPRLIAPTVYVTNCRNGSPITVEGVNYQILEIHHSSYGVSVVLLSRDPAPSPHPARLYPPPLT